MTPQIQDWVNRIKKQFINKSGKILEIGSLNVNGGIRFLFDDAKDYIGIDAQKGLGVDRVMSAHYIFRHWKPATFDMVICLETLEHDQKPWISLQQMYRVLKRGGYLIISTPTFGFPEHRYPKDYFRYGMDAFKDIFYKDFQILNLETVYDIENSPSICCIGKKQ